MFMCNKCGLYCKQISKMPQIYSSLVNGNGQCKFFDETTNLCSIYERRPIICNIDKCYKLYFSQIYSLEDFYELNYRACRFFQENSSTQIKDRDVRKAMKGK